MRGPVVEEPASEPEGRMSRRWLLSRAGAAAAGRGAYEGTNGAANGYGVWGNSKKDGLYGTSSGGFAGVRGEGSDGVVGVSTTTTGYGVRDISNGIGVKGEGDDLGVSGDSTSGYGGQFKGGKAQLRLVPKPTGATGPPTGAHAKGEMYMDSEATLFVCVKGGNPATRKQLTTS